MNDLVTLSDVKKFFRDRGGGILGLSLFLSIGLIAILLSYSPPKYLAQATFREVTEKPEIQSLFKTLFGNSSHFSDEAGAATVMKSHQVLQPLIQKMGLQGQLDLRTGLLSSIWDNLNAECRKTVPDLDTGIFQDILYKGERKLYFSLSFWKDGFEIFQDGILLYKGRCLEKITLQNSTFTITRIPKNIQYGKLYPFTIVPWEVVSKELKKEIRIYTDKINPNILNLEYSHRDRNLATNLLNQLMLQYQEYLKQEQEALAHIQLAYLEKRHEDFTQKMEKCLDEHTVYVKNNLGNEGFISLDHEVKSLLVPQQMCLNKLHELDLEKIQLEGSSESTLPFFTGKGLLFEELNHFNKEIEDLKTERDILALPHLSEIEKTRQRIVEVDRELQRLPQEHLPTDASALERDNILLQQIEEKKDLFHKNYSRLLSVQEKMLQERLFPPKYCISEFEGLDLAGARECYKEYNAKLDDLQISMKQLSLVINWLSDPKVEITALSGTLLDTTSLEILQKATQLFLKKKDEANCSSKELERIEEELQLQRGFLKDHILELIHIKNLSLSLVQRKIKALQEVMIDRINQRIYTMRQQANEVIAARKTNLEKEKSLLLQKLHTMRERMLGLSTKWRMEQGLKLKLEASLKMMQAITELVESKTIGFHLHQVQSKPLDIAILPIIPQSPHLLFSGALTFLGSFLFLFLIQFARSYFQGLPLTKETLQALNYHVAGSISQYTKNQNLESLPQEDLETLRKLSSFILARKPSFVLSLIQNKRGDYSYLLAELLAKRGVKSLVIYCDFSMSQGQGFIQYCKKEIKKLPIKQEKYFDVLVSGGATRYGAELLGSSEFLNLLHGCQKEYDIVILVSSAGPKEEEAKIYLSLSDMVLLTIKDETMSILQPFTYWGSKGDSLRLSIVFG